MTADTFGSPYHGSTREHRAWMQGYADREAGRAFYSGDPIQAASVTLAYNRGWKAAGERYSRS